jgi:hypothetical protein
MRAQRRLEKAPAYAQFAPNGCSLTAQPSKSTVAHRIPCIVAFSKLQAAAAHDRPFRILRGPTIPALPVKPPLTHSTSACDTACTGRGPPPLPPAQKNDHPGNPSRDAAFSDRLSGNPADLQKPECPIKHTTDVRLPARSTPTEPSAR